MKTTFKHLINLKYGLLKFILALFWHKPKGSLNAPESIPRTYQCSSNVDKVPLSCQILYWRGSKLRFSSCCKSSAVISRPHMRLMKIGGLNIVVVLQHTASIKSIFFFIITSVNTDLQYSLLRRYIMLQKPKR